MGVIAWIVFGAIVGWVANVVGGRSRERQAAWSACWSASSGRRSGPFIPVAVLRLVCGAGDRR